MKIEGKADLPIFKILSAGGSGPSLQDLQNLFAVGSRYEGTVLDILPGEGALLRIAGQTVMAQTGLPLARGLKAEFEVREVSPQVVLKMVGESPAEEWQKESFRQLLTLRQKTGYILGNVARQLREMPDSSSHIAERLRPLSSLWDRILVAQDPNPSVFKLMGLGWENKLRTHFLKGQLPDSRGLVETDIKGLVMQTLNSLSGSKPDSALARALSSLLNLIEGYQSANMWFLSPEGESVVFLPVWFSKQAGWGECELLLDREPDEKGDSKDGSEGPFRALFFLNMSGLGPMRVSLEVRDKKIKCLFMVADKTRQEYVIRSLPELSDRLASSGFTILSMECIRKEKKEIEDVSVWFETLKKVKQPLLHVVI
ncbi:MAG: flagellar hook-length control protein FliK [Thermodesulfobacteriota bacterium]|nr:flagellar hook-length control protein FliK [Thermodesulfobacteriota bacterium]